MNGDDNLIFGNNLCINNIPIEGFIYNLRLEYHFTEVLVDSLYFMMQDREDWICRKYVPINGRLKDRFLPSSMTKKFLEGTLSDHDKQLYFTSPDEKNKMFFPYMTCVEEYENTFMLFVTDFKSKLIEYFEPSVANGQHVPDIVNTFKDKLVAIFPERPWRIQPIATCEVFTFTEYYIVRLYIVCTHFTKLGLL